MSRKYNISFEITVEAFVTPNPKELNDLLIKTIDEYFEKQCILYNAGTHIDEKHVLPEF